MEVRGMSVLIRVTLAVAFVSLFALLPEAAAQQLSLSGTVRDDAGVIPGATVTLASGETQVASATTDAQGGYRFDNLAPGTYEMTVTMRGFETAVRTVALGATTPPVDVVLAVGRVSTTLTVTASAGRATASRLPVSNADLPSQVSSVPQELMRQQGTNTVGEALRNASGVQAFRWYGVYEQYTIRGFNDPDRDGFNAVLVDGLRFGGNRYASQTNNIQSIEVLKGPSSVLYGRGAVGGSINLVRKKPQALRAFDLSYRGGSFNTHQMAGGATGTVAGNDRVLYRVDGSFENSDGWRDAGAERLNVSPSLTFVFGSAARLTAYQQFNRNRYDGDGGVPLNIVDHPSFDRELRFSLPQDRVLVEDSQTQLLFSAELATAWQFRNSFQFQRTSDQYFVTEGVYGDPEANLVYREPLDFHHIRRPVQNQSELLGRLTGFGTHNLLFGYEYQRDKYRTEVTGGDDPDCLCGYWWITIAPMDLTTMAETQGPLDIETVERTTFVNDRINSFFAQDQIDVSSMLKLNVAVRVDDYKRNVDRVGGLPFTPQRREQTAITYRAGAVFAPRFDQQIYFGAASSFTPVTTVPADGSQLDPSTANSFEFGHRMQALNGRVDTSVAGYYTIKNNLNVRQSVTTFIQVGEQRSKGLDLDVNANLGGGAYLLFNYGFSAPRFEEADDLTGLVPRFVPRHLVNVWVRKDWDAGFNVAFGTRHVSEQFANNGNTLVLDAYTLASAAVGYRAPRWDWSLNVDNLFDNEDYFLPGHFSNLAFPGPPVSVTTTVRLRY
jgi:TonB-dependent siderophore receptor